MYWSINTLCQICNNIYWPNNISSLLYSNTYGLINMSSLKASKSRWGGLFPLFHSPTPKLGVPSLSRDQPLCITSCSLRSSYPFWIVGKRVRDGRKIALLCFSSVAILSSMFLLALPQVSSLHFSVYSPNSAHHSDYLPLSPFQTSQLHIKSRHIPIHVPVYACSPESVITYFHVVCTN